MMGTDFPLLFLLPNPQYSNIQVQPCAYGVFEAHQKLFSTVNLYQHVHSFTARGSMLTFFPKKHMCSLMKKKLGAHKEKQERSENVQCNTEFINNLSRYTCMCMCVLLLFAWSCYTCGLKWMWKTLVQGHQLHLHKGQKFSKQTVWGLDFQINKLFWPN